MAIHHATNLGVRVQPSQRWITHFWEKIRPEEEGDWPFVLEQTFVLDPRSRRSWLGRRGQEEVSRQRGRVRRRWALCSQNASSSGEI